jgi:hypothetical protein
MTREQWFLAGVSAAIFAALAFMVGSWLREWWDVLRQPQASEPPVYIGRFDPAKTAGGAASKGYTGGFGGVAGHEVYPELLREPEPDRHSLAEYDAIYASEQGEEIVR